MSYNKLPADPTALILGIIAIIFGFAGCCCYGIFAIIPLTLSIIGLVMTNKSIKEFELNPEEFSPQSRSNVATAKIINIVALVVNAVITLLFIGGLIFYGTVASKGFYDEILKRNSSEFQYYEEQTDTINTVEEETYSIEQENDSLMNNNEELIKTVKEVDSL